MATSSAFDSAAKWEDMDSSHKSEWLECNKNAYDFGCAVCGHRLTSNIRLGRTEQWALDIRRQKRALLDLDPKSDVTLLNQKLERKYTEDPPKEPDNDILRHCGVLAEDLSYDPEYCGNGACDWLADFRIIFPISTTTENLDDTHFISGPAELKNDWFAKIPKPDHERPFRYYSMYLERGSKRAAFPVHLPCLKLLSKRICGSEDYTKLEPDVLYESMDHLATKHNLLIHYAKPKEMVRFSTCHAGQEYLSVLPEPSPELEDEIRRMIASGKLNLEKTLAEKPQYWSKSNPFINMPREIILSIAKYLDTYERTELADAIWPACERGNLTNLFWKSELEKDMKFAMPLLMNLAEQGSKTHPLSYRKLYGWFSSMTWYARNSHKTPPWLGMINRCRIWEAINPLAHNYFTVREQYEGTMPETEEFESFRNNDDRDDWTQLHQVMHYTGVDGKGWRRLIYHPDGRVSARTIDDQYSDSSSEASLNLWYDEWSDVDWDDTEAQESYLVVGAA